MILVSSPHKPFLYTPKGAVKRTPILQDYEAEIDALYNTLDQMNSVDSPSDWTPENSLPFIRAVVNGVMKSPAGDTDDIFNAGCDRLVNYPRIQTPTNRV